jgi:hypothetical protein
VAGVPACLPACLLLRGHTTLLCHDLIVVLPCYARSQQLSPITASSCASAVAVCPCDVSLSSGRSLRWLLVSLLLLVLWRHSCQSALVHMSWLCSIPAECASPAAEMQLCQWPAALSCCCGGLLPYCDDVELLSAVVAPTGNGSLAAQARVLAAA